MSSTLSKQLILLVAAFAITRIWPLASAEPWSFWEVFEARKLNQYGWAERQGALLDVHYLTGVVKHPELHNYPNHPAPIHWANMVFQRAFGDWGVIWFGMFLGLAGCVVALFALRQIYDPAIAFTGALLFTIAPSSIIYDIDPNQGAAGALIWPVAALCLTPALPVKPRAWFLGAACLLAGQVSWMSWTVFGALLAGIFASRKTNGSDNAQIAPVAAAVFIGGTLTVLLFALQVALYTPDWQDLGRYMGKQAAEGEGILRWVLRILTRSAMSLGPALGLGAVAGAITICRQRRGTAAELAGLIYLPIFGVASFALMGFFQKENWPSEYLVFATAILTCSFLSSIRTGRLRATSNLFLLILAVAGLAYVFLRFSNPLFSSQSRFVAELIAAEAQPGEVVATNLIEQIAPFPSWDVSGLSLARQKADRLLRTDISDLERLNLLLDQFHAKHLDIVYLWTPLQPVDTKLAQALSRLPYHQCGLPASDEKLPLSLVLRNYYWKLTGRHQAPAQSSGTTHEDSLKILHFRLTRAANGNVSLDAIPTTE